MTKPTRIQRGKQRRRFHHGVKFQNRSGRLEMAITHDGALLIDDGFSAATFGIVTVMDGARGTSRFIWVVGSSGPAAPVGVVGAKVVSQFMGNNEQIPCEVGRNHGEVGLVVHCARKANTDARAAHDAHVRNASRACVVPL